MKRVVLNLRTIVKVIAATGEENLTVKHILAKFNVGKTQVCDILKVSHKLKNLWLKLSNDSTERMENCK